MLARHFGQIAGSTEKRFRRRVNQHFMHEKLRRISLHQQGLTTLNPFGKGLHATKRVLEHLGYIQIDTLSVVERAHHHTLWTRVPDYQPDLLKQLVQERSGFEYWFHAASYLPMSNYRFVLPQMSAIRRGESPYYMDVDAKYVRHIMEKIRADGPLKARNFESAKTGNAKWWNWKPAKRALEKLFMQGDLMITERDGMEKIYDLTERVLPRKTNTTEPSLSEFSTYLIDVSLRAYGFTTLKQLTHLRQGEKLRNALTTVLQQKIAQGSVQEYRLDNMPKVFVDTEILDVRTSRHGSNVRLLSPFDNAIIHRDRVQQLFNFDYKLECYTPKEKRKFGYFCLPILYKDELVGRVDCKAHRKTGVLELISLHIESDNLDIEMFTDALSKAVHRFAKFNACQSICVSKVYPRKLTHIFRNAIGSV